MQGMNPALVPTTDIRSLESVNARRKLIDELVALINAVFAHCAEKDALLIGVLEMVLC